MIFGYNRESVSELRSKGVLRKTVYTEVDGSSHFFYTLRKVGLTQEDHIESNVLLGL